MKLLVDCLAVGAAGSLGAIARLAVASLCGKLFGHAFPIGTLIVNLSGSLFLGWFLEVLSQKMPESELLQLAIAVGFVGSYTTFSTFALESNMLIDQGSHAKALMNILGSVVLGLLAVRAGIWLGSK